jgi:stage II sporulation protein GA (sporulation sigma-E factor processing peptidase)
LNLALEGAAAGIGKEGLWPVLASVAAVLGLCAAVVRNGRPGQDLVEVELSRGEKHTAMLALRDTGNTLKDPVTGEQVFVAGADLAEKLLSLKPQQLASPVETMASAKIAGLRLIPYRSVGQPAGMLLAVRCKSMKVGSWCGSALVAFAPESIGKQEGYEMLAGGNV